MLENGPWHIRDISIILNTGSPTVNLTKEEVTSVPVWVKFHNVPMVPFIEDWAKLDGNKDWSAYYARYLYKYHVS